MASSAVLKFLLVGEDRTSKAFGSTSKGLASLHKHSMAVAAATLAVGAAMVHAGSAAAEDQKSQAILARALVNTTGATADQVAAVEDWISAQGVALGVADDQLRPALARLATSTKDVGEAQKLAAIAMDASAGTGKSLQTVAEALAKAHDGNVGALARLGIQTKDAAGKTLSFDKIVQNMSQTFKGQAAGSAETLSGKVQRLKLMASETEEGLGAGLLPVAEDIASVLLTRVVPAVTKVTDWFSGLSDGTRKTVVSVALAGAGFLAASVAAAKVASAISTAAGVMRGLHTAMQVGTAIARVYGVAGLATVKTLVAQAAAATAAGLAWIRNTAALVAHKAISLAVAGAAKAMAAAQWLVNVAMTANPIGLVVAALVALGAGLVLAWRKSETFRRIVTGAFTGIAKGVLSLASVWLQGMKGMVGTFLSFVGAVVSGAAKALGWVPGVGPKLKTAAAKFEEFRSGVSAKFDAAGRKVDDWKRKLDAVDKKKVTAEVDVDASGAVEGSKRAQRAINGVKGKQVSIGVDVIVHGKTVGFRQSNGVTQPIGKVTAYAGGGPVIGAGTGVSDSIMAALSHGEWVATARAVQRYGADTYAAMNAGRAAIGNTTLVVNVNGGFATAGEIARTVTRAILDEERKTGRQLLPSR